MRIAFVGKGGSGKTTVASLLLRQLMAKQSPVLAIDADINQHLATAVNWDASDIFELGNELPTLKNILRGTNSLIPSAKVMVKTTLPSEGSFFVTLQPEDRVLNRFAARQGSAYLLQTGGFTEDDLGQRCFHSKTGSVELVLNHLVDRPNETVLIDMTAGADAFASGLFSRFDLTLIVVEPTLKSVSVYEQYKVYAKGYGIAIRVIGNKVENDDDIAFIKEKCGDDLIGCLTHSQWIKRSERGQEVDIVDLESNNAELLNIIMKTAAQYPRDWEKYWQWGIHFHNLNAESWANEAMGCDVRTQIDSDFFTNFRPETVLDRADQKVA